MKDPYKKYVKALLNILTAIVILLLVALAVPKVIGFFMPFVVAWIIAAIANPVVHFLDKRIKIRRKAGSAIVIISVIALVILAGYWGISTLLRELMGFARELPVMWQAMEADLENAGRTLMNFSRYLSPEMEEQLGKLTDAVSGLLGSLADSLGTPTVTAVGNFAKNIPSVIVGTIMCLLASYFFVAERDEVIAFAGKLIPESFARKWSVLYTSLKKAVGGYFKAQLKIEVWIYLLLTVGFLILGLDYAFLIALGIAILDFLPVFGTGTVLLPWAVIKILGGDYKIAVGLLIIYLVGQLARQLIQPKIVGDSVGLPALPTLFLIFIGYKIGSIAGMILAVPAGIILVNMYQAGFFETTIDSVRILVYGFNHFRRLDKEDKKDILRGQEKGEEDESSGI